MSESYTQRLPLMLTPSQRAAVDAAAAKYGQASVSDYVRRALLKELRADGVLTEQAAA